MSVTSATSSFLNRCLASALLLGLMMTLLLGSRVSAQTGTDALPRPAGLEPAIRFWTRVYTEADTESGFLHDARNLSVVYRKVDYDRREIESYRSRIVEDLKVLASGKRTGLTLTQQEVLDAWPAGVDNATLAEAANNVRFQLGQSDRFIEGLIRSGAYREHIEQVAREKGLPVELAALPHVESSFHPGAYSHANAAGMWQFIRATGQRFMRIDNVVDERMDPYTATYAAMSLLEYNYNLLGSWPLALTAYNHGAGGLARAVRETGTNDIATIIANYQGRAFGFASRNFYPQFLAVLDVERQAQALFGVLHLDPAPDYQEFELQAYIEADTLAQSLGVTIDQLKFDNPALRPVVWQGGKRIPKGYTVKIQSDSIRGNLDALIAAIPDTQLYAYQTPDVNYVVQRGDSLSVIASRFDTSVGELVRLNQLQNQHQIRVGETLLLPHDTQMVTQTLASEDEPLPIAADGRYVVRSGDTLSRIADQHGVSAVDIMRLNGLDSVDRIYAGQSLQMPLGDEPELIAASYTVPEQTPADADISESLASAEATQTPERQPPTGEFFGPPAPAEVAMAEQPMSAVNASQLAVEIIESPAERNELAAQALAADPNDYSVAENRTIEVHASETLGHYAEWLGVRTQDLRNANNMRFDQPLIVGQRLVVDLSEVSRDEFELRRRQFHIDQQQNFFRNHRIQDLEQHQLAANENIDTLARQRYSVPLWLLRQYNPELDFSRVRVGQTIVFPVVEPVNDV